MNLRDLRYLVALADHKHFGRAAEACFVTQPTLSTQLRKLEQELGVQLVERGREVLLTAAGQAIVERARVVLGEVEGIRELARQAQHPERGRLTLGVFPTLGPYLLPHVVPVITARLPRLELYLIEEKTEALLHALERGAIDAAILALPVRHEALEQRPLFEEPFVLAVPAGHPLAERGLLDVNALEQQRLLLLEEGHCLRAQSLSVCELAQAREHAEFRATSLETLRQMVAAKIGITLLPLLATLPPVPDNPAVRCIAFRAPAPHRRLGLFWRRGSARRALLEKLAPLLIETPSRLIGAEATAPAASATPRAQRRRGRRGPAPPGA